jgi:preprotein translocase SecE subunit
LAGISIYKRNQGQVTRSVTAIALAVIAASICYYVHQRLLTCVPTAKEVTKAVDRLSEDYELVKPYERNGVTVYGAGTVLTDEVRKAIVDASETPGASPKVTARPIKALSYAVHVQLGVPILLFAAAAVGIFCLVNHERFADFLIATESEMKKVSWSSRAELVGATIVVIVTVLIMAIYIFGVDSLVTAGLRWIGIFPSAA